VSGNLPKENTFGGNATGVLFNMGSTGLLPTGSTFKENVIVMNTCGLRGPTSDNAFDEDVFQENGADSCP
jgi:hypothetical protein